LRIGARNHVAAPAIIAHAASGNVIDDYSIAGFEPAAARTALDDLPAWFVTGNGSLIALRALAKMLVIDATDIRSTDCGCFHTKKHFAVARSGHGNSAHFNGRVTGQVCRSHCAFHAPPKFSAQVLVIDSYLLRMRDVILYAPSACDSPSSANAIPLPLPLS
jgi:hypothetical protein